MSNKRFFTGAWILIAVLLFRMVLVAIENGMWHECLLSSATVLVAGLSLHLLCRKDSSE